MDRKVIQVTMTDMVDACQRRADELTKRMDVVEEILNRADGYQPLMCMHPSDRIFVTVPLAVAKKLFLAEAKKLRKDVANELAKIERFQVLVKNRQLDEKRA